MTHQNSGVFSLLAHSGLRCLLMFLPILFMAWPLRAANLLVATNGNDAWTGLAAG
ncbi:MAG: hypothetical protein ABSF95_01270 [Verrucomicrobiota bacterium]